jgi:hypothetical protein
MFEKAFILAGAVTAIVASNSDSTFNEIDIYALKAQIPELEITQEIPAKPDLKITHQENNTFSLSQTGSYVVLEERWNGKISPDLPHLLYVMAQHHWLNDGLFVIHSACVGNEKDGYILLVGDAGCGKTSTALECARKYGLKVFSGDKTVIEADEETGLLGIGGTKVLTSRNPEKGRWKEMVDNAVETTSRHTFQLKQEYYTNEKRVPIKAVVLLYLNDGKDSIEVFSKISAIHNLYPYFMNSQKEDVLLNEGNFVFDGTITPEIKQKNVPRLSNGIRKIRTVKVIGSMDYVTEHVIKILKAPA